MPRSTCLRSFEIKRFVNTFRVINFGKFSSTLLNYICSFPVFAVLHLARALAFHITKPETSVGVGKVKKRDKIKGRKGKEGFS